MLDSKIMATTKSILKEFGKTYFTEAGALRRNRVIEDLDAYTPMLMKSLLANKLIHDTYTENITVNNQNVEIFKLNQFVEMFTYKDYWEDSYTKFENKIGLTVNNKFIDESADVVLDFPFKDTTLKAGMSSEEETVTNENFLHENIAKEEIDELLEPKILKNVTKFDRENLDGNTNFAFSKYDNFVIKGNNLISLYSMKNKFNERVRLIYIDVPYFFKQHKENDSFKYNSNFKLSAWLTFMKNRLEIAKSFLRQDGSIWIHVGEDGMHYLKVLADSIFGSDHFVGTMPRKTREGKNDVPFNFSQDFDWMLIYTTGNEDNKAIVGRQIQRKYVTTPDFPDRPWRRGDIKQQKNAQQRPNSNFDMINPKTGAIYPVDTNSVWRYTKETFNEEYQKGHIGFPDDYEHMSGSIPFRRTFKDEDDAKKAKSSVFSDYLIKNFAQSVLGKAKTASKDEWIDNSKFPYAKPEKLLENIIKITTDKNDIVMDFFSGSGTTAAVAHKTNRQYLVFEQIDNQIDLSIQRLRDVIAGEQGGISKDVNWQGGGSFVYAELMEKNQGYLKDVQHAETTKELENVIQRMIEGGADFDFRVDLDKVLQNHEYQTMSLDDKKRLIFKVIDKNQLYYAYSDLGDSDIQELLSASDIAFNKNFYGE